MSIPSSIQSYSSKTTATLNTEAYQQIPSQNNTRKGVSTNERQNQSSSPVNLNKLHSPSIPFASSQKLQLHTTFNENTLAKKNILSSHQIISTTTNKLHQIPNRPANLSYKYIRNYSSFISEVQKNKQESQYFCNHCKDLLWEPVKCQDCSTLYCSYCAAKHYIKTNKKCNTCQKNMVVTSADENISKQLVKINLTCPNSQNGCQAYLSYNSFDLHQQDCRFKKSRGQETAQKPPVAAAAVIGENKKKEQVAILPVSNPIPPKKERKQLASCVHCYKNIAKQSIQQHENNCPLKLSACKYCQKQVPQVHMKVHEQYRCSKQITCSYCYCSISYDSMQFHQATCNKYTLTQCSYCDQSFYKQNISDHLPFCAKNPNNLHNKNINNYKIPNIQVNGEQSKKFLSNIAQNLVKTKYELEFQNEISNTNTTASDLANILIRGVGGSLSPSKLSPSTDKLKFMVTGNILRQKGRLNEYSIDQDFDSDKTGQTKMNTDASMSTEVSSNNIQDRIAALLNTSVQMNTTLPLSPTQPQNKFRAETITNQYMFQSLKQPTPISIFPQSQYSDTKQQQQQQSNQSIIPSDKSEQMKTEQINTYKYNTLPPSPIMPASTFLANQMTQSQRNNQGTTTNTSTITKGGITNNPAVNQILQSYLQKNDMTGRSNSLQIQQITSSQKVSSTNNLESKY